VSKPAAGKRIAVWGKAFCLCGTAILAVPVAAQNSNAPQSRAVVQPLPPAGVDALNAALMRLSRNSQDLGALIDAGNASLQLNDIAAAIGFFGRADELSAGNPRVKVGLAGAFVRSERPIEALRLFDEAEKAGASTAALAEDRGLAYDLVGDPASAQAQYARALAVRSSDELVRRMALSQAISGDRVAFEKTLYPLLERRDFAAYRTRAFALAILGEEGEAVAIAEAVMPAELSARMTPYLRYMNRLTKAQQAAAGNLGIFPRAAQIGRDDPRIAQYSGASVGGRGAGASSRTADAGLTPQGQPLGPSRTGTAKRDKSSPRRRPDRGTSSVPTPAADTRLASNTVTQTAAPARIAATIQNPLKTQAKAPTPQPVRQGELPPVQTVRTATPSRPGFEPAKLGTGTQAATPISSESVAIVQQLPARPTPTPTPTPAAAAPAAPVQEPLSVANAFAGFTLDSVAPDKTGAVDISAIKPKREVAEKPAPEPKPSAKPEPPKNPSRVWVQVATGRDRKALAFDWRRISRKSAEVLGEKAKPAVKPHIASWGQTNRLLAGPFANEKAARAAVSALKAEGIDSFTFTSSAGEEVSELS
jgi:tetratricopeptide (TPR) repeat protein